MKKIITLAFILTAISFTSCKKKSVEPATSTSNPSAASTQTINVQYRLTSASGHCNLQYTSLEDDKVVTTDVEVKKHTFSYSFTWTTKQKLSVKAYNFTQSPEEVLVEIYVNGVFFKSGLSNIANGVAVAEGVYTN